MNARALALALAAGLAFAGPLWAKDKHDHAEPKRGGIAEEAGAYHLELVVKDRTLSLYIDGHDGKPVDASKMRASANVFSGREKANVVLSSMGGNLLKGEAAFAIRGDAKIVVLIEPAAGKSAQARFQLGAKPDHKGHKH